MKRHQTGTKRFPFTLHQKHLKTQQARVILDLCLSETQAGKYPKCYLSTSKCKTVVFKFPGLLKSSVFVTGKCERYRPNLQKKALFFRFLQLSVDDALAFLSKTT